MNGRGTAGRLLLLCSVAAPASGSRAAAVAPPSPSAVASGAEIIVTATRQAQPLSKVPVSVSAFSQRTMDARGIKSFADVARFTPGVSFARGSNAIAIRGIASGAGAGTTGIYIDDTPIQIRGLGFRSDDALPAIFDLDRVEVLRGPQGTLFGAGSEGGTVRYITPQPSLTRFTTYDRAELSGTAHGGASYEIGSAIGGPIVVDRLGFRVSAWHRRDGGTIDHVDNASGRIDDRDINHGDVTVVRAALAWAAADGLLVTPSVQYQRRDIAASDDFFVGLSDRAHGVLRTSTPEYRGARDRFVLPTLNVRYDLGGIAVIANASYFARRNLTGYNGTLYDLSYYQSLYGDGPLYPFLTPTGINPALPYYRSPSRVTNTQRAFAQEVRVQSRDPAARLTWVAGLFYQRSRQRSTEELIDPLGNAFFEQVFGQSLESYFSYPLYGQDSYVNASDATDTQIAGFADVTYAVTGRLRLAAGGRVARTRFSVANFADGAQNGSRTEGRGRSADTPFTPRLGITWQADRDTLLYATWAKGFRAAGANPPVPIDPCLDSLTALGIPGGAPTAYHSDSVRSIELGTKDALFDRRLTIAASVYRIDWRNIQEIVNLPQCAIRFIDNLGRARSRGFDLQLTLRPVARVTIDVALGYSQARYTRDATLAPGGGIVVNKGDAIDGAPWTLAVGGQYDFGVARHRAYLRGDVEYRSRLATPTPERDPRNANGDPALIAPAANTFVSLRAGVAAGGADVSLFVDNLLDSAPQLGWTHQDSATLLFENQTFRPRTIGVTVTWR